MSDIEVKVTFDEDFTFREPLDSDLVKLKIQSQLDKVSGKGVDYVDAAFDALRRSQECVRLGVSLTEYEDNEKFTVCKSGEYMSVILGLGSNKEDKRKNLEMALETASAERIFFTDKVSSYYVTEPAGFADQDNFLNIVVKGRTELSPRALLKHIKQIETRAGRGWTKRNRPRVLDIDILYYGNTYLNTEELVIPHKRLKERPFVTEPLREIAPGFKDPVTGIYLESAGDSGIIEVYKREDL